MFLVFLIGFVLVCFIWGITIRPPNFPRGPFNLPLLGYVPFLGPKPYIDFMKLSQKYGKIFSLNLLFRRFIVLNDHDLIRKAFQENAIAGKIQTYFIFKRNEGKHGILFNEGPHWQEIRRFTLQTLRDFGMGKSSLESIIQQELLALIDHFKEHVDKPLCLTMKFNLSILNALWIITTGTRFSLGDPQCNDMLKRIMRFITENPNTRRLGFLLPHIPWLPPSLVGVTGRLRVDGELKNLFANIIQKHKQEGPEGNFDYIRAFLNKAESTTNSSSAFYGPSADLHLKIALLDLFLAGSETTSSTLTWLFLLLSIHRNVQDKMHQELDEVVGRDRLPSPKDSNQMPYFEAVLMELHRFASLVPTVNHKTLQDIKFEGYDIPKNTCITANLYAVHRDPTIWEKPEEFYPEHFLTKEGRVKHNDAFMPFSIGKRLCLGESLAKMELFIFSAGLLQSFRFELADPCTKTNYEVANGILRVLKPYEVILTLRK